MYKPRSCAISMVFQYPASHQKNFVTYTNVNMVFTSMESERLPYSSYCQIEKHTFKNAANFQTPKLELDINQTGPYIDNNRILFGAPDERTSIKVKIAGGLQKINKKLLQIMPLPLMVLVHLSL